MVGVPSEVVKGRFQSERKKPPCKIRTIFIQVLLVRQPGKGFAGRLHNGAESGQIVAQPGNYDGGCNRRRLGNRREPAVPPKQVAQKSSNGKKIVRPSHQNQPTNCPQPKPTVWQSLWC